MRVSTVAEFVEFCEEHAGSPVAYSVEAPVELWRRIIEDRPELRETVAFSKTIPEEIIRELSHDDNERIRSAIAMKRRTPPDVLRALAGDPSESVRQRVAYNPKVPTDILLMLVDDEWEPIRARVQKELEARDWTGER